MAVVRRLLGRVASAVRRAALWVAHALELYEGAASSCIIPDDGDSDGSASDSEAGQDEGVATSIAEGLATATPGAREQRDQARRVPKLGARISRACAFAKRANEKLTEARNKAKTRLRDRISERRARKHQRV